MNKIIRKVVVASAIAAAALVGSPVGAASADVGDGSLACNPGEICFTYDGYFTYQKHFWKAATHDGYYFARVSDGAATSYKLRDNAWGIKNRDTKCKVKVIDVLGFAPDQSQLFGMADTAWRKFNADVINQNDKHERVSCIP